MSREQSSVVEQVFNVSDLMSDMLSENIKYRFVGWTRRADNSTWKFMNIFYDATHASWLLLCLFRRGSIAREFNESVSDMQPRGKLKNRRESETFAVILNFDFQLQFEQEILHFSTLLRERREFSKKEIFRPLVTASSTQHPSFYLGKNITFHNFLMSLKSRVRVVSRFSLSHEDDDILRHTYVFWQFLCFPKNSIFLSSWVLLLSDASRRRLSRSCFGLWENCMLLLW